MADPARVLTVDVDELERVTAEVVREVPSHMVPSEVRRRLAANIARRQPSEARLERARKIAEEALRR